MRAFVYCRVSTQEQATDDHCSRANQEQRCRDYIKHRSWQLVKVLKGVGSGQSAERAGYQELVQAIGDKRPVLQRDLNSGDTILNSDV